ncbi:MAG: sorbitol-6-phosphate dehydrogenase [Anaerolineae bacterium]|nr:sorbitol-6-phosphate dehydrogenase [Anaerolineae bacterium]
MICGVLKDKVAIVTGGAQGLGEHLCHRLAQEGADVVVADLQEVPARVVANAIQTEYGRKSIAIPVDVTDEEMVSGMVNQTVSQFGYLDILVANAGILISGDTTEFDVARWRKVLDVDLVGYFICAKHALRVMKEQKSGAIVQINSKSGKEGSFKNTAYAASKFGGIGLTQSLALEFAEFGIRVNAVCPGNMLDSPLWVNSLYKQYAQKLNITEEEVRQLYINKVPMKRGCAYENVADLVVFLASDQSSYITGQAMNVTGGQVMH